jgi:hypothetical protein
MYGQQTGRPGGKKEPQIPRSPGSPHNRELTAEKATVLDSSQFPGISNCMVSAGCTSANKKYAQNRFSWAKRAYPLTNDELAAAVHGSY